MADSIPHGRPDEGSKAEHTKMKMLEDFLQQNGLRSGKLQPKKHIESRSDIDKAILHKLNCHALDLPIGQLAHDVLLKTPRIPVKRTHERMETEAPSPRLQLIKRLESLPKVATVNTRIEVISLANSIQSLWDEVKKTSSTDDQTLQSEYGVWDTALAELSRQLYTSCQERASLLEYVRGRMEVIANSLFRRVADLKEQLEESVKETAAWKQEYTFLSTRYETEREDLREKQKKFFKLLSGVEETPMNYKDAILASRAAIAFIRAEEEMEAQREKTNASQTVEEAAELLPVVPYGVLEDETAALEQPVLRMTDQEYASVSEKKDVLERKSSTIAVLGQGMWDKDRVSQLFHNVIERSPVEPGTAAQEKTAKEVNTMTLEVTPTTVRCPFCQIQISLGGYRVLKMSELLDLKRSADRSFRKREDPSWEPDEILGEHVGTTMLCKCTPEDVERLNGIVEQLEPSHPVPLSADLDVGWGVRSHSHCEGEADGERQGKCVQVGESLIQKITSKGCQTRMNKPSMEWVEEFVRRNTDLHVPPTPMSLSPKVKGRRKSVSRGSTPSSRTRSASISRRKSHDGSTPTAYGDSVQRDSIVMSGRVSVVDLGQSIKRSSRRGSRSAVDMPKQMIDIKEEKDNNHLIGGVAHSYGIEFTPSNYESLLPSSDNCTAVVLREMMPPFVEILQHCKAEFTQKPRPKTMKWLNTTLFNMYQHRLKPGSDAQSLMESLYDSILTTNGIKRLANESFASFCYTIKTSHRGHLRPMMAVHFLGLAPFLEESPRQFYGRSTLKMMTHLMEHVRVTTPRAKLKLLLEGALAMNNANGVQILLKETEDYHAAATGGKPVGELLEKVKKQAIENSHNDLINLDTLLYCIMETFGPVLNDK